MKAIRVHEFGGPEVLKLEEVVTPRPSAGEVLVRMHAAGVNPYDTYMRAGTYALKPPLPYTPGSDGAGVVEAVGEGVKKVKREDRVYTARTLTGAYAEYALALEEQVHPLPEKIDFKQGAGIWVPYGTAYQRYITQQKRTLPTSYWCTAQVAVLARRPFKLRAPWVLRFSALQVPRKVLKWPSGRARIKFSIIAKSDIRKKFCKRRATGA